MKSRPLIFLVEDSRLYQKYLSNICLKNNYDFVSALNGLEAIEQLYTLRPDLILLDIHLPGLDGYSICKHVRNTPGIHQTPIIFITSNDNENDIVEGFKVGGNDYVTKPFNQIILESRMKSQLENVSNRNLLNNYISQLENINEELRIQKEHSEFLASRDHLTGIYNRRFIQNLIHESMEHSSPSQFKFSLALFDVDDFKRINDTYGHPIGDYVLREIVHLISQYVREEDCLGRWGGEEFLLFLPYTPLDTARSIVEAIRKEIANHTFGLEDKFSVTITGGLSEYISGETYTKIFTRIDDALYQGKHTGKNTIIIQ